MAKFVTALTVPIALMGVVIPKANFLLSSYLMDRDAKKGLLPEKYLRTTNTKSLNVVSTQENEVKINYNNLVLNSSNPELNTFNNFKNPTATSFKGFSSFMTGLTHQQKMAATDGGYAVGRVVTARKKNEAIENAFKMSGMMYLNFIAPKHIEKGLDKLTNRLFGINPSLDPKIMANKRFLASVRANKLELPESTDKVIDFLDTKPK